MLESKTIADSIGAGSSVATAPMKPQVTLPVLMPAVERAGEMLAARGDRVSQPEARTWANGQTRADAETRAHAEATAHAEAVVDAQALADLSATVDAQPLTDALAGADVQALAVSA